MILDEIRKLLMPHLWAQDEPDAHAPTKYDARFGFDNFERHRIESSATKQEMDSANLELNARSECARAHINYRGCIYYHNPFFFMCRGYKNELDLCYLERKINGMKEFEREKRLNQRERRLREQMF